MTLLVLPLVDQVDAVESAGLRAVYSDHRDLFISFAISFLVIFVFWSAHEHAFSMVRELSSRLRTLNMWWLLLIAFLPFPTALVGKDATTGTVPLYIGTMFVLSVLTSAMTVIAQRAATRGEALAGRSRWAAGLTWSTPAVFGLCAAVGAVNADLGLLGLLLLVVVRVVELRTLGSAGE